MTERPRPEVEVCFGPQCSDMGGRELAVALEARGIECTVGDCRSQCPHAPLVLVNQRMVSKSTVEKVEEQLGSC